MFVFRDGALSTSIAFLGHHSSLLSEHNGALGFGLGDRAAIGPFKPFLCFCCCYLGRLCFTGRYCLSCYVLDYATTLFTLIMSLVFFPYLSLPTYLQIFSFICSQRLEHILFLAFAICTLCVGGLLCCFCLTTTIRGAEGRTEERASERKERRGS